MVLKMQFLVEVSQNESAIRLVYTAVEIGIGDKMSHNTTEVAIIGGGLAGLTAATYLARAGKSVTLLERSHTLGGRAATQQCGEFYFNEGPHAIYKGGASFKILREMGIKFKGELISLAAMGARDGKIDALPSGPLSWAGTSLLSSKGKVGFIAAMSKVLTTRPKSVANITPQAWLQNEVPDPEVRDLLMTIGRTATYTNAPDMLSMETFLSQLVMSLSSVYYLDHGWQTLVDALEQAATQAGVQIINNARVSAVEHEGSVAGVRLANKSLIPASAVILAGSPGMASALVDNGAHPDLRQWAESAIPVRLACLDLALRRLPRPERTVVLGLDRPLYFSVHSRYANLGPDGAAVIHAAKYLNPNDPADPRGDEQELEAWMDFVQPGWRDEVIERRYLPQMAAINAMVTAKAGGYAGRPSSEVPGIRNLYLAGDWVGGQGLLADASFASARQSARMIIEH
jgi:phytoene dehydrogenase-like protein